MKKIIKPVLIFLLVVTVGVTAFAKTDDRDEIIEQARLFSSEFYEMMMLLLDDYAGRELTPAILYEAALRGMADELDAFSEYMSADEFKSFTDSLSGHFEGIGIQVDNDEDGRLYIFYVIPGSPAEEAGLLNGDRILKINGTDAEDLTQYMAAELIRSLDEAVVLEINRNGFEYSFTMDKRVIALESVEVLGFDDIFSFADDRCDNIRYIYLSSFDMESSSGFRRALRSFADDGVEGIILDLRGNSGGYLDQVVAIARMILPEGPIYYEVDASGEMSAFFSRLKNLPFEHIVVLTDRYTASASELLAAALQDSGVATVVGETTYGKGVIQTSVDLITGGAFKYTYAEYLRRSGEKIDRIGVIPDEYVKLPETLPDGIELDEHGASEHIILLKDILGFLDYEITDASSVYDENTREQVKIFKDVSGLNKTDALDADTIAALNDLLYTIYAETDVVLETGYNILLEKIGGK